MSAIEQADAQVFLASHRYAVRQHCDEVCRRIACGDPSADLITISTPQARKKTGILTAWTTILRY